FFVLTRITPEWPTMTETPHQGYIHNRRRELCIQLRLLGHISHAGPCFLRSHSKYPDFTLIRSKQSQHEPQQGGLASTVGTDNRDKITLRNGKVHVFQNQGTVVRKRQTLYKNSRSFFFRHGS